MFKIRWDTSVREMTVLHDLGGALYPGQAEGRLEVNPVPYSRPDVIVFPRCLDEALYLDQRRDF